MGTTNVLCPLCIQMETIERALQAGFRSILDPGTDEGLTKDLVVDAIADVPWDANDKKALVTFVNERMDLVGNQARDVFKNLRDPDLALKFIEAYRPIENVKALLGRLGVGYNRNDKPSMLNNAFVSFITSGGATVVQVPEEEAEETFTELDDEQQASNDVAEKADNLVMVLNNFYNERQKTNNEDTLDDAQMKTVTDALEGLAKIVTKELSDSQYTILKDSWPVDLPYGFSPTELDNGRNDVKSVFAVYDDNDTPRYIGQGDETNPYEVSVFKGTMDADVLGVMEELVGIIAFALAVARAARGMGTTISRQLTEEIQLAGRTQKGGFRAYGAAKTKYTQLLKKLRDGTGESDLLQIIKAHLQ